MSKPETELALDDFEKDFLNNLRSKIDLFRKYNGQYRDLHWEIPNLRGDIEHSIEILKKKFGLKNFNSIADQYSLWKYDYKENAFEKLRKIKVSHDGKEIPFLSEGFLYDIIGKDDARTVLALIDQIERECGKA